ncbi:MAG: DUF1501 domain-containing protein [Rhodospirillales bacterium]|nr:DUF1501 domain-containing protein [Rhodospirillales bacterium]
MNRRHFLSLATALPMALIPFRSPLGGARWDRTLVLVELFGGNDGLNTVVPYTDPEYHRLRPTLAIGRDRVLPLDERLGFHPSLAPLMGLWRGGELAVALGVGYPDPNLSHFRSIDIWDTASDAAETTRQGWVARLLEESRPTGSFDAAGVVLGRNSLGPLANREPIALSLDDPHRFVAEAGRMEETPGRAVNPALAHVTGVHQRSLLGARALSERNLGAVEAGAEFPLSPFGRRLETVARLLASGLAVPVVKVSLSGFDTHAAQAGVHGRLLRQLADALAAFAAAMKAHGLWERVLVMTYAEFGRRVAENGSLGTDHGTAAPHFLLGGRVRGGLYGAQPPLDDLSDGNLAYRLHFRSLYATAAREWWGVETSFIAEEGLGCIV